ncbi:MAG: hypothetical protein JXB30_11565 [Anaerolineae bacterium]|nr:hypothetical protein [Anaerolineae bacterium]
MRNINKSNRYFIVSKQLDRRRFLHLLILSGAVAGCRRLTPNTPSAPPTASPGSTLALDLLYALENAAVDYSPHPRGCDVTSIRGSVLDADGSPVAGVLVHVWADDVNQAIRLSTDAGGYYSCDVASSTNNDTYHVQLTDQTATTLFSDVIVVQAVASCDLNLMTVNFVATQ